MGWLKHDDDDNPRNKRGEFDNRAVGPHPKAAVPDCLASSKKDDH
jgi:hypothetical protein